jgi:hypothetical protein
MGMGKEAVKGIQTVVASGSAVEEWRCGDGGE